MELFSNGSSNTCISNPSLENLIMLPISRFGLPLFVLTQKKMHMNQSLHTNSKNVGQLTPPISAKVRENYSSLDGLRAYAAVGIVLMHVQANLMIKPSDNILTCNVIPWFTNFTLLFMIISAFSMCCGYYERIKSGAITPAKF